MNLVLLTTILFSSRNWLSVKGRGFWVLLLVSFTELSYAQATVPTAQIGSGRHLVNVTLALMGIIGLIFAISWFVKRFSQGTFSANAHIKILSAMPLGTRERIVLIEAGGQQLLLGITSTHINTLHVFETPIVVDDKTENPSDFSRKLMAILQQKSSLTSAQDSNNKNNSAP
ncbi:flagellar biosynthetic protein FliO [Cellvibrio fibrivorans]|uniref:Flagellar protein n=1 Tax=Cellvibrio fibrivorans TaxID=126350 RepID=A0ABU1UWD9_9GAMM|nr:flagellar biosynthetic protein FliO [Cellvibrio fibrivorans]MDR7089505.1 flagellar biosynthetic protein FliO [Cellvibrio fibrivorans]